MVLYSMVKKHSGGLEKRNFTLSLRKKSGVFHSTANEMPSILIDGARIYANIYNKTS